MPATEPFVVSFSRTYPAGVARSFDAVISVPLPSIFRRRYGAIPPITRVVDAPAEWGTVGQTRTIVLSDGGRMGETLTVVDRPSRFGYHIELLRGPLKALVSEAEGLWEFAPAGTGVRITWTWRITPRHRAARRLLPVVGRLWRGYARQGFDEIETLLLPA